MRKLRGAMVLIAALSCAGAMSSAAAFGQLSSAAGLSKAAADGGQVSTSSSVAAIISELAIALMGPGL